MQLPLFCETKKIKELGVFKANGGPRAPSQLKISNVGATAQVWTVSHISQISAQLHTFVAYSTGSDSIVLLGSGNTRSTTTPTVMPSLQNRGVISIVLGHDHFAALLENGKLLTWGTSIATGMGDPYKITPGMPGGFASESDKRQSLISNIHIPHIRQPTEVHFNHELAKPRERFVFSVAGSGHHLGALIVDLEEVSLWRELKFLGLIISRENQRQK